MKKLSTLLFIFTIILTSCESKWDKLAGGFLDLNQSAQSCSDYIIEVMKIWESYENDWSYDKNQLEQDFSEIEKDMNWSNVASKLQDASKVLDKHYPKDYQSARNDILRLYNIGRDLRNLAQGLTLKYIDGNDLDDFYDKFDDLVDKYISTRDSIENDHPEIPSHLYSVYDIINNAQNK